MVIDMNFKHMEPRNGDKGYAQEQSARLRKFFRGKIHVNWSFAKERATFVAHCHILGNHMDYFGGAQAGSLSGAIDLVIDKMEKQVRRHKEMLKNRLHNHDYRPHRSRAAGGE